MATNVDHSPSLYKFTKKKDDRLLLLVEHFKNLVYYRNDIYCPNLIVTDQITPLVGVLVVSTLEVGHQRINMDLRLRMRFDDSLLLEG